MAGQKNSTRTEDYLSAKELYERAAGNLVKTLCEELYEQAAADGSVPEFSPKRGRPRRRPRLAAKVAATAAEIGVEETWKLLEELLPGQRGERWHRDQISDDAKRKRVQRYLREHKAEQARFLRPEVADEAYNLPEERLDRLLRLIDHSVRLAYEQWLRGERNRED